jgi:Histidine kinase-, DNA gyrase B-, and HSP90-like ATPase
MKLMTCRPTRSGTHARIEVWDTGIGIAPEDQEKVFQEFYQVANPQRDRRMVLGVGLGILQRCCRLLALPRSLRSALGAGTRVTIWVPLGTARPEWRKEDTPLSSAPASSTGRQVMVIEDDEMSREALAGQEIAACVISGDTDAHARQQVEAAGLVLLSKPARPANLRSLLMHLTRASSPP